MMAVSHNCDFLSHNYDLIYPNFDFNVIITIYQSKILFFLVVKMGFSNYEI